jgi:hypothetical protein
MVTLHSPELSSLIVLLPMLLAIGWLSLLLFALKLLGPILGQMLQAKFQQFEQKNPGWAGSEGVKLLHDIGLSVVEIVGLLPMPDGVTDPEWDEMRIRSAVADLAGRAAARGIATTTQMLRRAVEDALTSFKQGQRSKGL